MINFLKGIIAGIGGVSPGLSGSVLLIICGLYQGTLEALGSLFLDFKKHGKFLLPIVSGMFVGVMLFSKVIDFFLNSYEVPTRFCFLGLILGTVPMFYKEVKKKGFSILHGILILAAAILGIWMFAMNPDAFRQIQNPTLLQSIIIGVAVVATAIIPGLDPAVVLSSLGFYEVYVSTLANVDLQVLLPMLIGVAAGGVGISFVMSRLFERFYTATFSIVFGLFLSMIPNMLNEKCVLGWNAQSAVSLVLMIIGFFVSLYLGDIEKYNTWIKNRWGRVV